MYTSDGNPDMITILEEMPEDLAGQFDPEVIASQGRSVLQYSAHPSDEQADLRTDAHAVTPARKSAMTRRKRLSVRSVPKRFLLDSAPRRSSARTAA